MRHLLLADGHCAHAADVTLARDRLDREVRAQQTLQREQQRERLQRRLLGQLAGAGRRAFLLLALLAAFDYSYIELSEHLNI